MARGISTVIGTLLFLLVASLLLALALRALSELTLVFDEVSEFQKNTVEAENLNLTIGYATWRAVSASALNTSVSVVRGTRQGDYSPTLLDSPDNQVFVVESETGDAPGVHQISLDISLSTLGFDFNGTLWVRFNSTVFVKVYRMGEGSGWVLHGEWLAEPNQWLQLIIKNGWVFRLFCYYFQPFKLEMEYLDARVLSPSSTNLKVLNTGTQPVEVYGVWLRNSTWEARIDSKNIIAPGNSIQLEVDTPLSGGVTYEVRVVTTTRVHKYKFTLPVISAVQPPPPPPPPPELPIFRIASHSNLIQGLSGSRAVFTFQVSNVGNADGVATVEIYNHQGVLVNSTSLSIPKGATLEGSLGFSLPLNRGTYTWRVKVYNHAAGKYDDEKTFTVKVLAPYFSIVSYNATLYGLPRTTVYFVIEVANNGDADSSAIVEIYNHLGGLVANGSLMIPAASSRQARFSLTLPSSTGAYAWSVKVLNNVTKEYDDTKSFNVYVVDVKLDVRSVIVYESFESMPAGWASIGGTWTIVSGLIGNCLQGTDNDGGPGRTSVYYWQQGETPTSFQAIVKVGNVNRNDRVYRGLALLRDSTSASWLYTISAYATGGNVQLMLRRFTGAWSTLRSSTASYSTTWYTIYLSFTRSGASNVFSALLYDQNGNQIASLSYADTTTSAFQPRYLAVFTDGGAASLFDELVVASDDPRVVRVRGLPSNWRVELWRGTMQISSAVADATGTAILNVIQYPIVRDARLVIKDDKGNLIVSKDFALILGSDTYEFIKP